MKNENKPQKNRERNKTESNQGFFLLKIIFLVKKFNAKCNAKQQKNRIFFS